MIALSSQTGQLHSSEQLSREKEAIYIFSTIKLQRILEIIGNLSLAISTVLKLIHRHASGSFLVPGR